MPGSSLDSLPRRIQINFRGVQRAHHGFPREQAFGQRSAAMRIAIIDRREALAQIENGDVAAFHHHGSAFAQRNVDAAAAGIKLKKCALPTQRGLFCFYMYSSPRLHGSVPKSLHQLTGNRQSQPINVAPLRGAEILRGGHHRRFHRAFKRRLKLLHLRPRAHGYPRVCRQYWPGSSDKHILRGHRRNKRLGWPLRI
jgi:hypothetical protein